MKKVIIKWLALGAVIPILVMGRLIDHPPNFVPILAISLFCGSFIRPLIVGLALPTSAMLISDIYLGFYGSVFFVYLPILLTCFIGCLIIRNISILYIGTGLLSSSILFFILSNFGVWLTSGYYPLTITGLIECYILGIPFFHNTLLSTIIYGAIFYITWAWVGKSQFIIISSLLSKNKHSLE